MDELFDKMDQWGCFMRLENVDIEQLRADFDVVIYKCIHEVQQVLNNEMNKLDL